MGVDPGMFFISKQAKIQEQINLYCDKVAECIQLFQKTVGNYCRSNDRTELKRECIRIHEYESAADDVRRDIELVMYSKSVFPESRGDILGLLESMDRIPNQTQHALQMLYSHRITVPETFIDNIEKLLEICRLCIGSLLETVRKLFGKFQSAADAIARVDQLESQADQIENNLIESVFASSEIDDFKKLLLRDLVIKIASITDRAENVAYRIRIIVAKRSV